MTGMILLLAGLGCGDKVTHQASNAGGGGGDSLSAKEYYLDQVHPELVQSCAICHKSSADCTPKLMADDGALSYDVLRSVAGMVAHADNSNLIHHGAHTGPALTLAQETIVREWLSREYPDKPSKRSQVEALAYLGLCMRLADFEETGVYKLAYQQTQFGPCGACHKTGEAGTWIGYNAEEMFSKNTQRPWIKRLVHPHFDSNGEFTEFKPSNRFIDKPELANQCGSAHPSALIPAKLEQSLNDYVKLTQARYDEGKCEEPDEPAEPDSMPDPMEEQP
jgi:hypothetical protein